MNLNVPRREDSDRVRSDPRISRAALQHQRHQRGELPHACHVVQGRQPKPILQVPWVVRKLG